MPLLSLSVVPDRELVRVVAVGEVDVSTADDLDTQLHELWAVGWNSVQLDLHQVSFMDSTGLRVLLKSSRYARDTGSTFTIIDGSPAVRRLLQLSGLDDILPVRSPTPSP